MDVRRSSELAEMARDAAIERSDFLVRAGEQLERFMAANADRLAEVGGLVLIDDDPDYLAVAPDGTFRSRSRVYDEATGEWVSETEVIETAAELIELYNPADVLQAFADAESEDVGVGDEAVEEEEADLDASDGELYAGAADTWAAGQPEVREATDESSAALALYELALDFQDRSQRAEAGLIEQFETAATGLLGQVGTLVVVDDDDEHLALGVGGFRGRVVPEGESDWQDIADPDEIVRYYDPTDVFGDLAEAIAEAYPGVAEGGDTEDADEDEDDAEDEDAGDEPRDDDADDDAADDAADEPRDDGNGRR